MTAFAKAVVSQIHPQVPVAGLRIHKSLPSCASAQPAFNNSHLVQEQLLSGLGTQYWLVGLLQVFVQLVHLQPPASNPFFCCVQSACTLEGHSGEQVVWLPIQPPPDEFNEATSLFKAEVLHSQLQEAFFIHLELPLCWVLQ